MLNVQLNFDSSFMQALILRLLRRKKNTILKQTKILLLSQLERKRHLVT